MRNALQAAHIAATIFLAVFVARLDSNAHKDDPENNVKIVARESVITTNAFKPVATITNETMTNIVVEAVLSTNRIIWLGTAGEKLFWLKGTQP